MSTPRKSKDKSNLLVELSPVVPAAAEPTESTAAAAAAAAPAAHEQKSLLDKSVTFADLGVCAELVAACKTLGYVHPTRIQADSLPYALQGKDIIGLAQTGSGKTASFLIPIFQDLLNCARVSKTPTGFALILAPTRELAYQIKNHADAMGSSIGAKCTCVVGGMDMTQQAIELARWPHVIIATPGRLVQHLNETRGFHLRGIKYLVLDEADRLLNMDFEKEINIILGVLPEGRRTYLYSATMTSKVQKLQRALKQQKDAVKIEATSSKFATVATLVQQYMFIPAKYKDCYLVYLLNELAGNSCIVFAATCHSVHHLTAMLRNLGFSAVPLHGQMTQTKRLGALNKFTSGDRKILVATDVAQRGLDLPAVDVVVNFDVPTNPKDYVQRVGRTARAGQSGRTIALVTQYDVGAFQKIEEQVRTKMEEFPSEEDTVLLLLDRVSEAQRIAAIETREAGLSKEGESDGASGKGRGGARGGGRGGRGGGGRGGGRGGGSGDIEQAERGGGKRTHQKQGGDRKRGRH